MTERELIDQLCDLRPDWSERRAQIHELRMYYVDGATLGRELVEAVLAGRDEPWMRAAFEVIERALDIGTQGTQNLVVVGLFEAMQGPVYERARPSEVMDGWLGLLSQTAWADLIEGWTGTGIRTIAAWRGVIINGPRHLIELRSPGFDLDAELAHGVHPTPNAAELQRLPNRVTWRYRQGNGEWVPTNAETERILQPIRPLACLRKIGHGRVDRDDVYATLVVDGAQGRSEITFGAELGADNDDGRIAHHKGELYLVDFRELLASWSWIAERR